MFIAQLILLASISTAFARYHDFTTYTQLTNDSKGTSNPSEHVAQYWYNTSFTTISEHLARTLNNGKAKNIILFLGDGMSIATVTAARIYMGQLDDLQGEEQRLSWEKFPYTGLSKTYCVNSQVADSACSGTAYLSGVKTNIHTIGVTADVAYKDWQAMQNTSFYTPSILQWAQEAGKGTGIITTCKVTDASPTATYAHTADRDWQTDQDILADAPTATGVQDIATQLIQNTPGINIKVILGGGREVFLPNTTYDETNYPGLRGDNVDLIQEWKDYHSNVSASYITNRDALLALNVTGTDYLLGLFAHYHMDYHMVANATYQPTLEEMTSVAISMMQKEENGYFLFIEGGRIDHGHHDNWAHLALDEANEFHKAIALAVNMTSEDDTLIVVTADHAHTMTMDGYPSRGSDIINTLQQTNDSLAYSTLTYSNGPNPSRFDLNGTQILSQHNITADNRTIYNYRFPTIYQMSSETHDGQDVAVYARGPCAHLLTGNYEQTVIPHVMAYAAGIGPAADASLNTTTGSTTSSGLSVHHSIGIWILTLLIVTAVRINS